LKNTIKVAAIIVTACFIQGCDGTKALEKVIKLESDISEMKSSYSHKITQLESENKELSLKINNLEVAIAKKKSNIESMFN